MGIIQANRISMTTRVKTVFISSFHILISRNIIGSPFLDLLLARSDIRVVLIVPDQKKQFFERTFRRERLIIESVPRGLDRRDGILRYLSLASSRTRSLAIKRVTELRGSGSWLVPFIGRAWFRPVLRALNRLWTPRGRFGPLLDRYHPDIVFATDVQSENDVRLIVEARDRGITTVGMVRSWDNLTCKGTLRIIPEALAVNNDIVKGEAVRLHGVPADRIAVVGIPHYDRYPKSVHSREEFAKAVGLDPKKRFVVFAPTGDRYLAENRVDQTAIELAAKALPKNFQLLVRLPPSDTVSLAGLNITPNIVVHRPGQQLSREHAMFKINELSPEDDEILRDTLAYCDLVIAGPSTIAIDAAVFDRPVILVAFDGLERPGYYGSVRRYYDYDHWRPVFRTGGTRTAKTPHEYRTLIHDYLVHPERDREARAEIVRRECFRLDGSASQRLVRALLAARPS